MVVLAECSRSRFLGGITDRRCLSYGLRHHACATIEIIQHKGVPQGDIMTTRRQFLHRSAATGIGGILASGRPPLLAQGKRVKRKVSREEAEEVHRNVLIIDGHNDVPVEGVARGHNPLDWRRSDTAFHTDLPRMKQTGYDAALFIVGDGPIANVWVTIERTFAEIKNNPQDLMLALSASDVERASRQGKVGVVMAIEGIGRWLDGKPEIQRILYRLGVRSIAITHGEGGPEAKYLQGTKSPYGPCTPGDREHERKNAGGLSELGREVIRVNHELGIITDLAHINDKSYFETLEHLRRPPIVSHTAVFSLCHHYRCLTDDQIRALAEAGGAMGIAFAPSFIHPDPEQATIDRVVEHILYVADLVGIDHVGIGTDFDGLGKTVPVVPEMSQLVRLTERMLAHGMTEGEIKKVWGGNFLRLLRANLDRA